GPAPDPSRREVRRVVDVQEAFGFLPGGALVLVQVDVVVEVELERARIAPSLRGLLLDVLDPPADVVGIRERRLPALGVIGHPAMGPLDDRTASQTVAGEPDGRARLGGRLRLDGDVRETIVLALEGDAVLRPEALQDGDPLHEPARAIPVRDLVEARL